MPRRGSGAESIDGFCLEMGEEEGGRVIRKGEEGEVWRATKSRIAAATA